ncbi:hypothetical protein [Methyloversatilis thermotolerans]|uniref:hypothetical protein n=1 Tax=Methyloversatilis thermotolerans TaxID=1346290 RepID=UPI0003A05B72|nr:hypothetical protein [Methyloversatilis thermotolerans]
MKQRVFRDLDPVSRLEARFPSPSLVELRIHSTAIEDEIRRLAADSIPRHFACRKSFRAVAADEFLFNDTLYSVQIATSLRTPTLQICLLNTLDPQRDRVSSGLQVIHGIGFFNAFEIEIPAVLGSHLPALIDGVAVVYAASYTWLEEAFFRNIRELEQGFADALYRHLKIALSASGKTALASKVWFSVFSSENGYYALDGAAITQILDTLKARRYVSAQSPLGHVVELLGLNMPFEKSLSRHAIQKADYQEFSLRKAAYVSDMLGIFKTEEQMVEGGAYAIFPLGAIGERRLVAAFPSGLRDDLLPVFRMHAARFEDIYAKETSTLKRHIAKVQASYRKMDASELGGLIGGILGGIFKNI